MGLCIGCLDPNSTDQHECLNAIRSIGWVPIFPDAVRRTNFSNARMISDYLYLILCGLSLAAWGVLGWQVMRRRAATDHAKTDRPIVAKQWPVGLADVFMLLGGWIVAQLSAAQIWALVTGQQLPEAGDPAGLEPVASATLMLILKLATLGFSLCLLYYQWKRFGSTPGTQTISRQILWREIVFGIACGLVLIPGILMLHSWLEQFWAYEHQTISNVENSDHWWPLVAGWITAVAIAPLVEEYFCRTVLQGWLRRIGLARAANGADSLLWGGQLDKKPEPHENPDSAGMINSRAEGAKTSLPIFSIFQWMAIVVSSAFFAFLHLGHGPAPISLFVFSICSAIVYQLRGWLIASVVMHMMLNTYTMLSLSLQFVGL